MMQFCRRFLEVNYTTRGFTYLSCRSDTWRYIVIASCAALASCNVSSSLNSKSSEARMRLLTLRKSE